MKKRERYDKSFKIYFNYHVANNDLKIVKTDPKFLAVTGNTTAQCAATKTKVDLSTYTIVPYMSPNMKINSDRLVEETIEYFRNYNLNGIT